MVQVTHEECPYCGHKDCYSYNTELNVYNCFSCGRRGKLTWEPEEEEEGLSLEPYIPDNYRGISKKVMEKHGVYFTDRKVADEVAHLIKDDKNRGSKRLNYLMSLDQDSMLNTVHYTYPNGTKHRELPKEIKISGKVDKFYGEDDYTSGKTITITEGEEDRLSVIQIMGDWPCVSVPGATPSKDFWENARKYLQNFEKIVLSVDNDEPGDKLVDKFYRMFPGKVYRVNHGKYKDANDFLRDGASREYKQSWWNAQKVKPDTILSTSEDFHKLYHETPDYEYFPTGIDGLDDKMLGIHKGAFTLILAPTGIGKTEFMRYLEWQAISETKYSIATCHLEETPLRSLLGLVSYDLCDNVTRKDLIDNKDREADVLESMNMIAKKESLYQFQLKTDMTTDDLVDQIRFLVTAMGVDFVFLEPLQDIVSGDTSTKESLLTDLSNKLKRLAPELNVGIVVIAHANEDGDAKYCRSIVQSAAYEVSLRRDVDAEDPQERNRMYVSVGRKNRTGGGSGPAGSLTFESGTYMLTPDLGPQEPVFDNTESSKVVGF